MLLAAAPTIAKAPEKKKVLENVRKRRHDSNENKGSLNNIRRIAAEAIESDKAEKNEKGGDSSINQVTNKRERSEFFYQELFI